MGPTDTSRVEQTFRREFGRAVATLVRLFGDIDLAEEAVQDAFVVAVQRWPDAGVPPNPGAGSSPPPATGPSTGSGGSPPARAATPKPFWPTMATSPRSWDP